MGGPKKGTVFPNRWVSGPDPVKHKKYLIWLQQKNQANFRGEIWLLDFEDWLRLWADNWDKRGRKRDHFCMTRTDYEGAWALGNVEVITRAEHVIRQKAYMIQNGLTKGYKKRRLQHG